MKNVIRYLQDEWEQVSWQRCPEAANDLAEIVNEAIAAQKELEELRKRVEWKPTETAPKSGEFLVSVWEGDWNQPRQNLRFYHASGYPSGPVWGKRYSTEEGQAYELFRWMPLPEVK